MNRLFILFVTMSVALCTPSPAHAQRLEDVGAGVINFFLRNPKTADRMKPEERIALDIIADLLRTEGQREHELAYAVSTGSQITINIGDGRQAQFVRNTAGDVFLLLEGVIYPIAPEFVNEAATGQTLDPRTDPPRTRAGQPTRFLSSIQRVSAGPYTTCVITTAGAAYCAGETVPDVAPFVRIGDVPELESVAPGQWWGCALSADAAIYCWGEIPGVGRIGTATAGGTRLPGIDVRPLQRPTGLNTTLPRRSGGAWAWAAPIAAKADDAAARNATGR